MVRVIAFPLCMFTSPLQRAENHVKHRLLTGLVLVQHRQAGSQRKVFVEIIGFPSRDDDDPVLVDAGLGGVAKNLGTIEPGHFHIHQQKIDIGIAYGRQPLEGIGTGFHLEPGVELPDVIGKIVEKSLVVIDDQYLSHASLNGPGGGAQHLEGNRQIQLAGSFQVDDKLYLFWGNDGRRNDLFS